MQRLGKNIADLYFFTSKKVNQYIEKITQKELEKEKRNFYKKYKMNPTDEEIQEIKKNIVMRKGIYLYGIIILLLMVIINWLS
jgi:hypothetical protein